MNKNTEALILKGFLVGKWLEPKLILGHLIQPI